MLAEKKLKLNSTTAVREIFFQLWEIFEHSRSRAIWSSLIPELKTPYNSAYAKPSTYMVPVWCCDILHLNIKLLPPQKKVFPERLKTSEQVVFCSKVLLCAIVQIFP